jgi:hypothetical protein
MQAARLVGSGLTQLVMSMPTRIRSGDKAAEKYIEENIYQPTIPKATEYVGDFGEMMEQLETKYKLPPIMPELLAFQGMAGPATGQAAKVGAKAGKAAGMNALQAINDAMVYQTGPLSQGPLSMLAPKAAVSHVVKPNPGIMIPGKMSNVREAIRQSKGNYGARRVERAADEIPNLENLYKQEALEQAFTGDNASAMITLSPAEFERYALELKGRTKADIGPKMAELARQGDIDKYTVPMDEYIKHLQRVQGGFSDVPYLNLYKDEVGLPTMPKVTGHEGRHRSRALADQGAPTSLVQINPRGDLREGMPRRTQEEFIEALKEELERSNRLVLPESDGPYQRPAIEFPEPYAEGGLVNMAAGGLFKGTKAARKGAPNAERSMPARGALRFADEPAGGPSVIKEKGGNWVGGNVAGNVDKRLNQFKTPTVAGETPAQRIPKHEALLQDPTLNQDQIDRVLYQLEATKGEAAVDQWIANNVGNYIKKDMATPTDPVRLMFEKRAQEIEARFQADMNRAQRTRARAEAETDPRRQANLTRQAAQQEEQAKFDRDLANEHVTHLPKDAYNLDEDALEVAKNKRRKAGFPAEGMAQSEPAKRWENLSDEAIDVTRAGDIQKQQALEAQSKQANLAFDKLFNEIDERYSVEFRKELQDRGVSFEDQQFMNLIRSTPITEKANFLGLGDQFKKLRQESFNADKMFSSRLQEIGEENPFVFKVDPETKLYSGYLGDLGIDHVIDVIKQDVRDGRIRPEQLNKLSMDQAVQRTAEFNMEQAKKMRDTAIKQTEGMPVHKEYPEGYKWVELTAPKKDLPSGWSVKEALNPMSGKQFQVFDESGAPIAGAYGKTEESAISSATKQLGRPELEEALKYEGDTMGHCVGGYCPDVLEGRSRIYSLRDKRGEPHVTVEVQPHNPNLEFKYAKQNLPELYEKYNANRNDYFNSWPEFLKKEAPELLNATENKIVQIKGKQNRAPKEEYLPFVQDFVRGGEWSDVGDLRNTGLRDIQNTSLAKYLKNKGVDAQRYLPEDEYLKYEDDFLMDRLYPNDPLPTDGMKRGGSVHISDNPDTMMMELGDRHFQVGGIVDAAARAAKAAKAAQLKKAMKASEALAQIEGKNLNITQADRTKVGEGLLGGPGFSGLQLQEGPHRQSGAVWGVKNPGTAKTMLGGLKNPLGNEYFTTMIGSPTQHQSNQMVFDKLYSKFKSEAKKGNLDPELQQKINERLANAVDKDGNPVFPPDVDILSKDFKKIANTFDRRSIAGNLIGGVGVGGRKGQIIDYDKIIRDTTDPFLLDMPSGSLGHRLWTPSGEIIERPDLHPAFPAIATGEDLGVEFTPAAQDILMAPWIENVRQTKGRNPGYMDWTRGRPPSVRVSEDILRNLEESGNKEGGAITVKPKKDGQKFKPGKKPDQILKHGQAMPRGKDPEVDIGQMMPTMAGGGKLSKVALEAIQRMKAMRPEIAAKSSLEQKALAENTAKYARDIQPFSMTDEEVAAEMKRLESKGMAGGGEVNADDLILEERPL